MKTKKIVLALLMLIIFSTFLISCAEYESGLKITNKTYVGNLVFSQGLQQDYVHVFSCQITNEQNYAVQFTITYSARFGGIFSNLRSVSENKTLNAKESATFRYEWEQCQVKDLQNKNIKVSHVERIN